MPLRSTHRYFLMPSIFASAGDLNVRVVELSLRGARLEVDAPLPVGSRQRIVIDTTECTVNEEATVLWSQVDDLSFEHGVDRYVVGVEFENPGESLGELIERLLLSGSALRIEDFRTADRFRLSVPITGVFGTMQVTVVDLSIRGARVAMREFIPVETAGALAFQIDTADGPLEVMATVAWCIGAPREGFEAGLNIEGQEERMRAAIHRLCMRNEARIDLQSLGRKFESLRQTSPDLAAAAS